MLPIPKYSDAAYGEPSINVAEVRSYPIGNLKTILSFIPLKEFAAVPTDTPTKSSLV